MVKFVWTDPDGYWHPPQLYQPPSLQDMVDQPRKIPIIGNTIGNVGNLIDLWHVPCSPDGTLLVKAMFAYMPMLVWTLVKPEPVDYLTKRLSGGHKRIRRRKVNGEVQLPDTIYGNGPPGPKWASFSIKAAERAGWYLLVIDATTTWAVNWTSMAMSYSGCVTPGVPYGSLIWPTDQSFPVGLYAAGTYPVQLYPVRHMSGMTTDGTGIFTPPNTIASAAAGFAFERHPTLTPNAEITRVFIREGPSLKEYDLDGNKDPSTGSGQWGGARWNFNTIAHGQSFALFYEKTEGWGVMKRRSLQVYGAPASMDWNGLNYVP